MWELVVSISTWIASAILVLICLGAIKQCVTGRQTEPNTSVPSSPDSANSAPRPDEISTPTVETPDTESRSLFQRVFGSNSPPPIPSDSAANSTSTLSQGKSSTLSRMQVRLRANSNSENDRRFSVAETGVSMPDAAVPAAASNLTIAARRRAASVDKFGAARAGIYANLSAHVPTSTSASGLPSSGRATPSQESPVIQTPLPPLSASGVFNNPFNDSPSITPSAPVNGLVPNSINIPAVPQPSTASNPFGFGPHLGRALSAVQETDTSSTSPISNSKDAEMSPEPTVIVDAFTRLTKTLFNGTANIISTRSQLEECLQRAVQSAEIRSWQADVLRCRWLSQAPTDASDVRTASADAQLVHDETEPTAKSISIDTSVSAATVAIEEEAVGSVLPLQSPTSAPSTAKRETNSPPSPTLSTARSDMSSMSMLSVAARSARVRARLSHSSSGEHARLLLERADADRRRLLVAAPTSTAITAVSTGLPPVAPRARTELQHTLDAIAAKCRTMQLSRSLANSRAASPAVSGVLLSPTSSAPILSP